MLGFSQTREWVYPQSISGRFTTIRRWTFLGLHLLLLITPWITINGKQSVLFDLPARKFYLLGLTLWPQDFPFLAVLLRRARLRGFAAVPGDEQDEPADPVVWQLSGYLTSNIFRVCENAGAVMRYTYTPLGRLSPSNATLWSPASRCASTSSLTL